MEWFIQPLEERPEVLLPNWPAIQNDPKSFALSLAPVLRQMKALVDSAGNKDMTPGDFVTLERLDTEITRVLSVLDTLYRIENNTPIKLIFSKVEAVAKKYRAYCAPVLGNALQRSLTVTLEWRTPTTVQRKKNIPDALALLPLGAARETYQAFATIANATTLVQRRSEYAQHHGYPSYAEYILARDQNMIAGVLGPEKLEVFLLGLLQHCTELLGSMEDIHIPQTVESKFPIARVIRTLQSLLHAWLGITMEQLTVPAWNSEVRAWLLCESDGTPIGVWYWDIANRAEKKEEKYVPLGREREVLQRIEIDGRLIQLPIVHIYIQQTQKILCLMNLC